VDLQDEADDEDEDLLRSERLKLLETQVRERTLQRQIDQLDGVWARRRQCLLDEFRRIQFEIKTREAEALLHLESASAIAPSGPAYLKWVDSPVYAFFCIVVLSINLAAMVIEVQNPEMADSFWCVDQCFLAWYLAEVGLKFCYHRQMYLLGKLGVVWWNWLDLGIVVSGVIDQWALPIMCLLRHLAAGSDHHVESHSYAEFIRVVRMLRVLRLVRIVKIGRYFLVVDLSWVEGNWFQTFIMGVVALNAVCMGMELDIPWQGWCWLENAMLCIYIFELAVQLKQHQLNFFTHATEWFWNCCDLIIVVSAVMEQWAMPFYEIIRALISGQEETSSGLSHVVKLLRVLRLLRILRLARVFRKVQPLYKLLEGVMQAMQGIQWVLVLAFVVLYVFALVSATLVGHGLAGLPNSVLKQGQLSMLTRVPESLFLLFKVMNSDVEAVDPILEARPMSRLLFVIFLVVTNWMILATLTAVVSENMVEVARKHHDEQDAVKAKEESDHATELLKMIFADMDADGSKTINAVTFKAMLNNETFRSEIVNVLGLDPEDFEDLFSVLSIEDTHGMPWIHYDDFVNKLAVEGNSVLERSVFRLEKRVRLCEKISDQYMFKVEGYFEKIMAFLHLEAEEAEDDEAAKEIMCSVESIREAKADVCGPSVAHFTTVDESMASPVGI